MARFTRMLSDVRQPMPHAGRMLQRVMKQKMIGNTEMGRKLGIAASGLNQYFRQPTLHAALLWKLGEILEYNFFAELAKEFPLQTPTAKELELQQQLADLKKENEIYQKILSGKLGQ